MTPANGAICKRCGKPADAKPFAFKANNDWNEATGMHNGCAQEQANEDAAQQGFSGAKQPEGEPLPPQPQPKQGDKLSMSSEQPSPQNIRKTRSEKPNPSDET